MSFLVNSESTKKLGSSISALGNEKQKLEKVRKTELNSEIVLLRLCDVL